MKRARTWRKRTLPKYTRVKPRHWYKLELAARCFESGKPKVCYPTSEDADRAAGARYERGGAQLRVYPCGAHWHLTKQL